ncbi:MAG: hypothetical protein JXA42_22800 [Anaerolineales bacterium]|nr:hypothetical protein [Anaerolineales bacterium]
MKENFKDQSRILVIFGALLLAVGAFSFLLGPIEMYCFYLFSNSGRFHYEGFGFGSFMFANIATQIIGYYTIGITAITIGYGHIQFRQWTRYLIIANSWIWIIFGIPLLIVFLLIAFSTKELSMAASLLLLLISLISYFLVPAVLIRYYSSPNVRHTFETRDKGHYRLDDNSIPIFILCIMNTFYALMLHIPIFFRGSFPFFGHMLTDLPGFFFIVGSMALLILFATGIWYKQKWAWWGNLIFFLAIFISTITTFLTFDYQKFLITMRYPSTEMDMLKNVPLEGYHLALFFGFPILLTLVAIFYSRRNVS